MAKDIMFFPSRNTKQVIISDNIFFNVIVQGIE